MVVAAICATRFTIEAKMRQQQTSVARAEADVRLWRKLPLSGDFTAYSRALIFVVCEIARRVRVGTVLGRNLTDPADRLIRGLSVPGFSSPNDGHASIVARDLLDGVGCGDRPAG